MVMHEVRKTIETLLDKGLVKIIVNICSKGVEIPKHFLAGVDTATPLLLSFNLSWNFKGYPMKFHDKHVEAELRFNGTRFNCIFPYDAIVGAQQDLKPEVRHSKPTRAPNDSKTERPNHLRVVK